MFFRKYLFPIFDYLWHNYDWPQPIHSFLWQIQKNEADRVALATSDILLQSEFEHAQLMKRLKNETKNHV